jgi:hypothetical protein
MYFMEELGQLNKSLVSKDASRIRLSGHTA